MINVPFDELTSDHIHQLVANPTPESRTLDYKEALPGDNGDAVKDFLADVAAFANTAGGDIVYGIAEKRDKENKPTGLPDQAVGLFTSNTENEIQRLEQRMRDGLAPRLIGVRFKAFGGFPNGPVIVMRVPRSLVAPHMVAKGESRFYLRQNTGKQPMDIAQIRQAFLFSENLGAHVRRFREERVARIAADEAPLPLRHAERVVLHFVPLAAMEPGHQIDLGAIEKEWSKIILLGSHQPGPHGRRYNLDGLLLTRHAGDGYTQFFRDGCIESVGADFAVELPERRLLASEALETALFTVCETHQKLYRTESIETPLAIMLSLIGVKGCAMALPHYRRMFSEANQVFDRDVLLFPEIIISEGTSPLALQLKPMIDMLWQAAGWEKSLSYERILKELGLL